MLHNGHQGFNANTALACVDFLIFNQRANSCVYRRNSPGDREQALGVMLQVLRSCDHPAPDMFYLCGRIYKDIFLDSDCKDTKNRDNAIQW